MRSWKVFLSKWTIGAWLSTSEVHDIARRHYTPRDRLKAPVYDIGDL